MNSNELEIARNRAREIQVALKNAPEIGRSEVDHQTATALLEKWLPEGLTQCRIDPRCVGVCQLHRRCETAYWRRHHEKVAYVMVEFSQLLQRPPGPFYAAGCLYDLDYLKFPHDLGTVSLINAHPFPIVAELERLSFSPAIRLAVLEHAPHLGLERSTLLSLALYACGEMVTLAAANVLPTLPVSLPEPWKDCFSKIPRGGLTDPSITPSRFFERVLPTLTKTLAMYTEGLTGS